MRVKFFSIFKCLLLALLIFSLNACSLKPENTQAQTKQPYLIMLSLDGFRWDYPDEAHTPVLDSLKKAGVFAEMKPSFPTKTFPNHYTIVTGLYPDHHGIVLNDFYANDLKKSYSISDRKSVSDPAFYGGEPIWNTATKQHLKAATLFWVGSEAPIQNMRPEFWYPYNHTLAFSSRIDTLVHWLSMPETTRPHLILWYYPEPDGYGHHYGPESKETTAMVEQLDQWLGQFFTAMRKLPVFPKLNFIVTADHGMASLSDNRQIILDQWVDTSLLTLVNGSNPVYNFKVEAGNLDKVYQRLKQAPHLQVWKHDSLPARLHYGHNIRTQDITVAAAPGWSIYWSWKIGYGKGTHGYDNDWSDMHAIFYAAGPAFKQNYTQPVFENVDIYPLIAHILQLKPAQTDGHLSDVQGMLKEK